MTTKAAELAAEEALNKDEETRARPESPGTEGKVTLDLFEVEVRRSASDTIIAIVPEHEIPILRAMHRSNRVTKLEGAVDEREYAANAETEFNRLLKSYHRVNSSNPVERVFLGGPDDLERYGFTIGQPGAAGPAQSVQRDNRKKAATAAKKTAGKK